MASSITKGPLLRIVTARGYSQVAPVNGIANYDLKTTTLTNKLVVVAAENESALTRISVTFRAGSRYETSDNLGAVHVIRTAAGLSTKNASQFAIIRNIQQVGASLTATADRETISYTLEGTRKAVEQVLPFLKEVATEQVFKPWELSELGDRLKIDLAVRPLQLRALDLLHKAAYRTGLGNSQFVPKFQIGKLSCETLQHYVANTFTSSRAAVVGFGIDSSSLTQFAQSLNLEPNEGVSNPSPYKGGEIRSDKGGDFAFVAIAGEGAAVNNPKEALAAAVLQNVLSAGPQLKWSTNDNGVIPRALGGTDGYSVRGINASYKDTGLVGILLAVPAKSAKKIVPGAVNAFKSASVTDADVNRGKNLLKTSLLSELESGSTAAQVYGAQAALTGTALSAEEVASVVDSVSASDVNSVLQKARKNISIASVGNLADVPYADDL
ncbi:cytochrome b-c1 complex subunit 2, mitochondrial [Sitophilus oryzae]|uniref:Cytochrome b-c1 complex subunit 2, mitochondrial n=1 Tax=Sitophilus oryzae TaxID=7048 RepID=A0A6J2X5S4_SITOR|nr:cytochrome b-c1 complex subunit 2, mitochondrial [Sitophilus oryzae]